MNWIFIFTQILIVFSINFYLRSHWTDESDTEEYMEFKKTIGFMSAYNYGYYVYFKNIKGTPNEHHNHLILNKIQDIYI